MNAFLKRWFPAESNNRRVHLALFLLAVAGALWIVTHPGDWPSLKIWWSVLSGASTGKVALEDYMRGGWMATAIVWTAIPLILLGIRLLVKAGGSAPSIPSPARPSLDWTFAIGLLLILLLAAGLRWPRMSLSLYNDEVNAFRSYIAGDFDRRAPFDLENDAIPEFFSVPWSGTFWGNRNGNNHALHSVTARLAYDLWKESAGAADGQIREWPLRLPALAGGLLSIAVVGLLTARVTHSSFTGLLGSLFLAVHPWHLRYSTEARGYGLLFLFAALAVLFLIVAIEKRGRYRWWTAVALAQAGCLWSYLGSIYFLAALNLVTAGILLAIWLRERPPRSMGQPQIHGWLWAGCLTLLLLFLLQAPNLAQLKQALALNLTFRVGTEIDWLADAASYFLMGMPWQDRDPGNTLNPALSKYIGQPQVMVSAILTAVLALAGMFSLLRRSPANGMLVVVAPLLAFGSQFLSSRLGDSTLLIWYVVYEIVFVPVWLAAGLTGFLAFRRERIPETRTSLPIRRKLILYAMITVYLIGITPALVRYRKTAKQALRPAIESIRGGTYPFQREQRKPITCGWWTHANYYDPTFKIAHTPEMVATMIRRARTENRPLYYVLGMRSLAREEDATVIDLLEKSGKFEVFTVLPGLEERQFRTTIYRLLP